MGVPSPFLFLAYFKWCDGMLKAETLISHFIMLEKDMNMKLGGVIHG